MDLESRLSEAEKEAHTGTTYSLFFGFSIMYFLSSEVCQRGAVTTLSNFLKIPYGWKTRFVEQQSSALLVLKSSKDEKNSNRVDVNYLTKISSSSFTIGYLVER